MNNQSTSKFSNNFLLVQYALYVIVLFIACLSQSALSATKEDVETIYQLLRQASELNNQGKIKEAIEKGTQALTLAEDSLGPEQPDTALCLSSLAALYWTFGDYTQAEPLYRRALTIREQALGPEHPDTIYTLSTLAWLYDSIGDYTRAEPLYQRALAGCEKAFGPEQPETAATLNDLAVFYTNTAEYAQAEPLYQRALSIREKVLGSDAPETAQSLNDLAGLYLMTGDYARAKPLYQRALSIREKVLGSDAPETAQSLNDLAGLYLKTGDYALAQPLYQRALSIREKVLGPEHPDTAECLQSLGVVYKATDDYVLAEQLYQRALAIYEKAFGSDHPSIAWSLNNLSALYDAMGDYARAEQLMQRALEINEKVFGPEHPDTTLNLINLGVFYTNIGEYAQAESLLRRALKNNERVLGFENSDTAVILDKLGVLYNTMGDYVRAKPLYQRALAIREKTFGSDAPDTAVSLNSLGVLYNSMGDYTKAEPLYQRALTIREKVLGPEHTEVAASLNNLGVLYSYVGDYARAEPLLQRALTIQERALGPEHTEVAASLNNIGALYASMGDYARAEPPYQRALEINEKNLSLKHPRTVNSLDNQSINMFNQGKQRQSKDLADQALASQTAVLANVLSFTSERQRLAYQQTLNPYSLYAALEDAPGIATAILRFKGVVLDSLVEDRRVAEASQDPESQAVLTELRSVKQRLAKLLLEVPADTSAEARERRAAQQQALTAQLEQLEARLARHVASLGQARRALHVEVKDIQAVLPDDATLIELLRYWHYLGKNQWEKRYGAVILERDRQPQWVSLGQAKDIDALIQRYQAAVRPPYTSDGTYASLLSALYGQLWAPIAEHLGKDTQKVFISPDGELNFLSFATLLTPEDRFLAERYELRYLASGRDLLAEPGSTTTKRMELYANPDFVGRGAPPSKGANEVRALAEADRRDFQDLQLVPLPDTARERAALEARAKAWRWPVTAYEGAKASEAQLAQTRDPWILHLATHGFFLPETAPLKANRSRPGMDLQGGGISAMPVVLQNPMHRSGLAFTGAQTTLEAWQRGEVPPMANDGILTAEEVGTLQLSGTWLATLSACDTGTGQARAGEGVLGLRRGFVQAGVENLLMTLWPVADEQTADFMVDFYTEAQASGNAPQALARVQREWLTRLRAEQGLRMAVFLGGPFILSSQGMMR